MRASRGVILFTTLTAAILTASACVQEPDPISCDPPPSSYYSPCDSAYKVIANLQLAYQTKNLDEYMECLHEEFDFMFTEDGIVYESWGRDIEENMTSSMFSSAEAEVIDLTLEGNSETVWYGDPSGETLMLVRSFDLMVYYWEGDEQMGFQAQGQAIFLCKPNADGEYRIWHWLDQSEM